MYPEKPRSSWWYTLPIFLGLIGGVIAYFAIRRDDPRKAKNCLYAGIVLAAIGVGLNLLLITQVGDVGREIGFDINT